MLKFSKPGFNSTWTMNFQMFKLDLEKVEEPENNCNICWIIEKAREFQKNIYFSFIDYAKACMQVRKQQLELDIEQQAGSKSGKKYVRLYHCHPAYLTCMQSTSREMPGWMK